MVDLKSYAVTRSTTTPTLVVLTHTTALNCIMLHAFLVVER